MEQAASSDGALRCGSDGSHYSRVSGSQSQDCRVLHPPPAADHRAASEDDTPLCGEIEVDASYFGGHRKGKCGRGAAGELPVFGLLKRGNKVYARVIPDVKELLESCQASSPPIRSDVMLLAADRHVVERLWPFSVEIAFRHDPATKLNDHTLEVRVFLFIPAGENCIELHA